MALSGTGNMLDRYYNELRRYFHFDRGACCRLLPEADESVFHFRNFLHEMPKHAIRKGFVDLEPAQVATDLFGHLHPGDKVAIITRFAKHAQLHKHALEARGLQVRVIEGQNGVEDFCFMMSAKKEIIGAALSTYLQWGAILSNATRVVAYSVTSSTKGHIRYFSDPKLKSKFLFPYIKPYKAGFAPPTLSIAADAPLTPAAVATAPRSGHPQNEPARRSNNTHPEVPRIVMQYGPPRTATTTQYHALCVAMLLLHGNAVDLPVLNTNSNEQLSRLHSQAMKNGRYVVVKTHKEPATFDLSDAWLFTTSESASPVANWSVLELMSIARNDSKRFGWPVQFTQTIASISTLGLPALFAKYLQIFQLPSHELDAFVTFETLWGTLRRCCGNQLSGSWRKIIHTRGSALPHYTDEHYCDSVEVGEVEAAFVQSELYRRFMGLRRMAKIKGIFQVSNVDSVLNGTYCRSANKAIAKGRVPFNGLNKAMRRKLHHDPWK